jgi:FlaA1/EpsC-like NDP-sugar epimerase
LDKGKPVLIESLARGLIELSGLRPGKDVEIQITELRPGEKLIEVLLDESTETLLPTPLPKVHAISSQSFEVSAFWRRVRELEEAARLEPADQIYRILGEMNIGYCGQRHKRQCMSPSAHRWLQLRASSRLPPFSPSG